jgi:hypothetical protein
MTTPTRARDADAYDVSCSGCGAVLRLTVNKIGELSEQLREKGWACQGWGEHSCPDCLKGADERRGSSSQ